MVKSFFIISMFNVLLRVSMEIEIKNLAKKSQYHTSLGPSIFIFVVF